MGHPHRRAAARRRARITPAHALRFGVAAPGHPLVRRPDAVGERAGGRAGAGGLPLLRARVHALAEALDPENIVIGGAAGAMPPLVGWAAVTGKSHARGALALPHRLPLDSAALLGARAAHQRRLRQARVPMLPSSRGRGDAQQILIYSVSYSRCPVASVPQRPALPSPRAGAGRRVPQRRRASCAATANGPPPTSTSIRSSTSRSSSWRRRSTRCSSDD